LWKAKNRKRELKRKDFDVLTHLQKLSEKGTPEETCCPFSYHSSSSSGLQLFSSTRTNASSFPSLFSSLLFSSLLFSSLLFARHPDAEKKPFKNHGKGNDEELYETHIVHGDS
jgi:hypothetical protein